MLLLKATGKTRNLFGAAVNTTPDSAFRWRNGAYYIFVNDDYYRLKYEDRKWIKETRWPYPASIRSWGFRGRGKDSFPQPLPRHDAAFYLNGIAYFFYKNDFLSCTNCETDARLNRNISRHWPGIQNNITAAVRSTVRKKVYFFKEDIYWSVDSISKKAEEGYPRKVSKLIGKYIESCPG